MECNDCMYYSPFDNRCDRFDKKCEHDGESNRELCFIPLDEQKERESP